MEGMIKWSPSSPMSLETFFQRYPVGQCSSIDGWIWVSNGEDKDQDGSMDGGDRAAERAGALLDQATKQILEKKVDGPLTKYREKVKEGIKAIAVENKYTNGKWCLFPGTKTAKETFEIIAKSLVNGILKTTPATVVKIADSPIGGETYLICVYFPNSFSKEEAAKVLSALLQIKVIPSAVKPDLYTVIDLKSKHESGVTPSVFTLKDFPETKDAQLAVKTYWDIKNGKLPSTSQSGGYTLGGPSKTPEVVSGWRQNDCGVEVLSNSTLPSQTRPYEYGPIKHHITPSGASKPKQAIVGATKQIIKPASPNAMGRPKKYAGFASDDEDD